MPILKIHSLVLRVNSPSPTAPAAGTSPCEAMRPSISSTSIHRYWAVTFCRLVRWKDSREKVSVFESKKWVPFSNVQQSMNCASCWPFPHVNVSSVQEEVCITRGGKPGLDWEPNKVRSSLKGRRSGAHSCARTHERGQDEEPISAHIFCRNHMRKTYTKNRAT